ncbi:MAG: hypothetical protein ACRDJB_06530 [Actinomycetota bacterium]
MPDEILRLKSCTVVGYEPWVTLSSCGRDLENITGQTRETPQSSG